MMIGFVRGQKLRLITPPVAAGTYDALGARFVFETGEWAGLSKFAHFLKGEEHRIVPIPADGEIGPEGHLNLSAGEWTVWVHGDACEEGEVVSRMTTGTVPLHVRETGTEDPLPLPPTYGEQVLALAAAVKEETEALLAASRAEFGAIAALAAEFAGTLVNRADGVPMPVWAGSEEEYALAEKEPGGIWLIGLFGEDDAE
ncbi:MAG: hypothetical protein J6Q17_03415 [Clostridia bacterium]|nr:hypothetical protein [Clostridia bacterium]